MRGEHMEVYHLYSSVSTVSVNVREQRIRRRTVTLLAPITRVSTLITQPTNMRNPHQEMSVYSILDELYERPEYTSCACSLTDAATY